MIAVLVLLSTFALAGALPSGVAQDPVVEPLKVRMFHIAVAGKTGFASVTAGLKIVDLSDPGNILEVATVVLPQSASYCALDGGVAYVAQGPHGVVAVDVSRPDAPGVLSTIDTPGSAMMVAVGRNLLAVADGSAGVAVYDVSTVESPKLVWHQALDGGYTRGVAYRDERVYACGGRAGVVIADAPAERTGDRVVATVATAGDARDIAFGDTHAFVADGRFGVTVIDLSDASAPRLVRTVATEDLAHGVAYEDGYVFVAAGLSGVEILESPSLERVNHLRSNGGYADKVTVRDGTLYVANDYMGLLVFDVRRPENSKTIQ